MLLAEIHGHRIAELTDSEDFLSSAVFGHLRYLPPRVFWEKFLSNAVGLPCENGPKDLAAWAAASGAPIARYSRLRTLFWPCHPSFGVPDMVLCFTGPDVRPLVIVVEAKLHAEKSGSGENDQLLRYLKLLDDLGPLDLDLSGRELAEAVRAVLYLTPRESLAEVLETASLCEAGLVAPQRLFRARWQDIATAAKQSLGQADETARMVLEDVRAFLRVRGLDCFNGFARLEIDAPTGAFYRPRRTFGGFLRHHGVEPFPIEQGAWTR